MRARLIAVTSIMLHISSTSKQNIDATGQAIDRIHDATVLYEYLLHILASVRKRHHDSIFQGTAIGPQLCMYRYLGSNVIHAAKEVMQASSTPYCLNKYKTT